MGKAAKRNRKEQKELEKMVFAAFEKAMTKISEEAKAEFFIKTGIMRLVGEKFIFDPQAYYKTAFTFTDKLVALSEEEKEKV